MRGKAKLNHLIVHLILLAGTIIVVFPFLWMILTSFKTNGEALQIPPTIIPTAWVTDAYSEIVTAIPFATVYMNTIISAVGQIFLIPQYLIVQKLGLLDTLPALMLPNLFSAFGTFLLRQFFMSLPKELEEAAVLDGCSRFQIFGKIMLPLVKPGIVALVIFTAKFAWNDFMWPLIVNTDSQKMTLAPALSLLKGQYLTNYPVQMAGAVMAVLPLVIVFIIFQKQFIEGVAQSGIKG